MLRHPNNVSSVHLDHPGEAAASPSQLKLTAAFLCLQLFLTRLLGSATWIRKYIFLI